MYTSRSQAESYADCPRYRYNCYHLNGTGVVPVQQSIPLVTGGAVHRGVEHLLNRVKIGQQPDLDTAVACAVEQYVKDCEINGFRGKGTNTDKQQLFTFEEQKALTEGLIRAWYYAELPKIVERYEVVAVEREIEPIQLSEGVWFQARIDAELKERVSGDYHNYSLKTAKRWTERTDKSFRGDLQGITEIWSVEQDALRNQMLLEEIARNAKLLEASLPLGDSKNLLQIHGFANKKMMQVTKKVMGIRFCILIKGVRMKPKFFANDPEALHITYSPLIRGYKKITESGIEFAHSWNYPNPENKSGESILGKSWEPFNVWETDGGVKAWIELLRTGTIQPNCGDILKAQVVTPHEYFRDSGEIEEAILELKLQESEIHHALELLKSAKIDDTDTSEIMADYFRHNRKHCEFHFGEPCEYNSLCWKPEVAADPIGSGLYQIRMPHHDAERLSRHI